MKRANRLIQIEMRKREATGHLHAAIDAGRQPLALVMKYPAVSMTATALAAGILTRVAVVTPLPAAIKLLSIPLVRRFISSALITYQKNNR